ncbi:MAG: methylglyoxal reductase (NADPH-dependent) gre2 [Bathelium mastoideum]|nr:MAG: methylglyoxal reductase (NADPH-dependent) gre2 [Bathelium mastoideum]KAI9675551.1 MAG: methylglyoxal reductase (NADPH-dependent) gre2 [Bathelium mastoideum]
MTRVLLTGGSGFIAAHVLDTLLEHGHSVVTTVRSQEKADRIKEAHPNVSKDKLDFALVEDIGKEGAFEKAVVSEPPFEAVIHTASPFHFNVTDAQKDLYDPAIIGTTDILKSIKKSAPSVKRVVITSSFAALVNPNKGTWPEHTYSEADWNPLTLEEGKANAANAYRASKTFAEKAAWEFLEKEKPNFSVATMNPPLVLGPIVHYLNSLSSLNTSNERVRDMLQGKFKNEIAATGTFIWIDVRDLALCHVKAIEVPSAANKRFFITAGYFSNKLMGEVLRKHFPEYASQLPSEATPGGDFPAEGIFKIDNTRAKELLGVEFRSFETSIVDTAKSLKAVGV